MEKEEGFSRTGRPFVKYVSQNILGTIGVSAYILADTFFISQSEGADGITALNLVLPVYSLIFAIDVYKRQLQLLQAAMWFFRT